MKYSTNVVYKGACDRDKNSGGHGLSYARSIQPASF
jgi:hypothetical protein